MRLALEPDRKVGGLYVAHRFLKNSYFHYSILVPLYLARGIHLSDVAYIETSYWLVFSLSQLPTGFLADVYGPRAILAFGCVLLAASYLALWGAGSLEAFVFAGGLRGFSQAMCNGSDSSMLKEALGKHIEQSKYLFLESKGWAARNVALVTSMAAGSLIASAYGLSATLEASALFATVAAVIPMLLKENRETKRPDARHRAQSVGLALLGSIKQPGLQGVYLLYVWLYAVDFLGNTIFQLCMIDLGVGLGWFGVTYAGVILVTAAAHVVMPHLPTSRRASALTLLTLAMLYYLLLVAGLSMRGWLGVAFVLLGYGMYGAFRGLYFPAARTWIVLGSDKNATATSISVASMVGGIFVAIMMPVVISIASRGGLPAAVSLCGAVNAAVVLIIISLAWLRPGDKLARAFGSDGAA